MVGVELFYLLGMLDQSVSRPEREQNKKLPMLMALMKQRAARLAALKEKNDESRRVVRIEQVNAEQGV